MPSDSRLSCSRILTPCCALLAVACARPPAELALSGPTMGTTYTVKVAAPPASVDPAPWVRDARRCPRANRPLDVRLSHRLGSRALQRERVHGLVPCLRQSRSSRSGRARYQRASGGAFDITVAPLVAAWGFGPDGEPQVLPGEEQIAQTGAIGRLSQAPRASRSAGASQGCRGAVDRSQRHRAGFAVDRAGRPAAGAARSRTS